MFVELTRKNCRGFGQMSSLMISAIGSEELSVSVNQTKKDGASSRPRFLPLVSDWSFVTKSCCQNNTKTIYYRTRFENFPGWQLVSLSTSMLCLYLSITVALLSDMYQTTNDHIVGNFQGRKLSRILWFYSHPQKLSPCDQFTFHKSFLCKMLPSNQSVKVFSLESFLLYGTDQHTLPGFHLISVPSTLASPELSMIISFDNTSFVKYGFGLKYCGEGRQGSKVNTHCPPKKITESRTYMHTM